MWLRFQRPSGLFRNERHLTHLCGLGTGPLQTQPSPPGKERSRKTGCSRNDALKDVTMPSRSVSAARLVRFCPCRTIEVGPVRIVCSEIPTGTRTVTGAITGNPIVDLTQGTTNRYIMRCLQRGPVAQRLEQGTHNPLVGGSNPSGPTNFLDRILPCG